MRKFIVLILALMLVISLAGCGAKKTEEPPKQEEPKQNKEQVENTKKYEDGIYFAQEDSFNEKNGWKYMV